MVLDLDDLIERVAGRVAELLADRLPPASTASPWLNVDEAAEYLRCKPKRLYDLVSQSRLRAHRDGSRLLFRREDLDEYVLEHGDSLSVRRSRRPAGPGDSDPVSARRQRAGRARTR